MSRTAIAQLAKRFARFGLVGGSGIFVDMGVFFLLADARMLKWDISLSKCIAAEVAILNNFIWNDVWTFRDLRGDASGLRDRLHRFLKFNLICLAGMAISVLVLNFQVRAFGINIYAANIVAILVASIWNFVMNLKFGWKKVDVTTVVMKHAAEPSLKE